jgi:hypothetical protein
VGDYGTWYCTRESVKGALDEFETARSNAQIDDAIEQGARDVEGLTHRETFAPTLATHRYDYPSRTGRPPTWRLWLAPHSLVSLTSLTSEGGAVTLTAAQYDLLPEGGPPYTRIEIDLGDSGSFGAGSTWQRAIAATGLWGHAPDTRRSVGSLTGNLAASIGATANLAWTTARFGVGDILVIDSERMIIRERNFVDSGQNLADALDASDADTAVGVSDGAAYAVEEIIQVGTESMRVVSITGNTLTVKRAWDGSQLAAHSTNADVYALTGVELDRAQCGTTLAAHLSGTTVDRWVPPALVATLNRAYALNTLLQERTGWNRTMQSNQETRVEFTGKGIAKLERDVLQLYGQQARTRAIV